MTGYLIRRLISTIVLLFIVVTAVFLLVHLLPGDPAMAVLGGIDAEPSAEDIQRVRERLGLNEPLHVQYVNWLSDIVQLDFGNSLINDRSINQDLAQRLPRTLMIIVPAMILAVLVGVPLGVAAASLRRSVWDPIISAIALLGFSTPVFVIGLMLILVFAVHFQVLPSGGYSTPSDGFGDFLKRAILPIITLSLGPMAITMRMTRSSVLEQLGLDYVRTARSKGANEMRVVFRHVLRNALMPVITIVGLQFGTMFAGSVLVETIFNWPGLNSYLLSAIGLRDYTVVQAVVLVVAIIFVTINFITDISYAILDPRIRYG